MKAAFVNDYSRVIIDASEETLDDFYDCCSYDVPGFRYIKDKRIKTVKTKVEAAEVLKDEGKIRFATIMKLPGDKKMLLVPTGLFLHVINEGLLQLEEEITYVNERPKVLYTFPPDSSARPYQLHAMDAWANMGGIGILKVPTGGGKTWIAVEMLRRGIACPGYNGWLMPAIILVPNNIIKKQWLSHLKGSSDVDGRSIKNFIVATYPYAFNCLTKTSKSKKKQKEYDNFKMVFKDSPMLICDEVHHGSAGQLKHILRAFEGRFRLGLSATAGMRSDNTDLEYMVWLGPIVYDLPTRKLVDNGTLARPTIRFIKLPPPKFTYEPDKRSLNARQEEYERLVVNGMERSFKTVDLMMGTDKQVLVLVQRIAHAELLYLLSRPDCGGEHDVEVISGPDTKERAETINRFESRELRVLISTRGIIGEGFDYDNIGVLILAGGGKSIIRSEQELGRGLRASAEKKEVEVYDFADYGTYLKDESLERAKTWHGMGFEISGPRWLETAVDVL